MASRTGPYPTTQVDSLPGRSSFHPYRSLDSFNDLRHRLPPDISAAPCPEDSYAEHTWTRYPVFHNGHSMPHMTHTYPFNHGQDASFQFPQGSFPYHSNYPGPDVMYNPEDLDMSSISFDDDMDGLDSNAQLRSQQLNSDGTPKRPMNAFMIFARKRRPMLTSKVSSEQPTMRTGEISKLLSKEWSEMPKEEKQFFLDQAKKLKDAFNLRWPDYVYRRRPNNSRKRRKLVGASGIGPVRNGHARVGTPADSAGANNSGDESQSQSADSVSSPLSTQSNRLYPVTDNLGRGSPGQISDRPPTPSVAPVGHRVGHAYNPSANAENLGEQASLGQTPYYRDLNPNGVFGQNQAADTNPQLGHWAVFDEHVPSGVVGTLTSTPPPMVSPPTAPALASALPTRNYTPGAWAKPGAGPEPQVFQGSVRLWGDIAPLEDFGSVNEQGIHSLLPGEGSALGISHLGFRSETSSGPTMPGIHSYVSDEAALIEGGHYHSAYIEADGLARPSHGSRSSSAASPYEACLPLLHENPPSFVGGNSWAPGTHPS